ncbi:MAG: type VI secretion system accessory protein TagJ [Planctomycetota bacterium]
MSVEELVKQGDLAGAFEAAKNAVRAAPTEAAPRTLLFQILCVMGDWERASTHLALAAEYDAMAVPMQQVYSTALNAETYRELVFKGEKAPLILGEPPEWAGPLLEAARLTAVGEHAAAAKQREAALEQAETTSGKAMGSDGSSPEPVTTEFEWIADADSRFGPTLEAIVNGKYYWVPFSRIKSVNIDAPEDLRDLVWAPAQFTWSNGGEAVGLIPVRYPGTTASDKDDAKLSRLTEWNDAGEETWLGLGQRVYATDAADLSILQTRRFEFDVEITADAPEGGE